MKTSYPKDKLEEIIRISTSYPEGFKLHPILQRNLQGRLDNLANGKVDWAMAEAMAFGSLLQEGYNVRLSGEDVIRGTFTQRHIGFIDQKTEKMHFPLSAL